MRIMLLNTLFLILLVTTLSLLTFYYLLDSPGKNKEYEGMHVVTGIVQSFEIVHNNIEGQSLEIMTTKKFDKFDNKLFNHLEYLQNRQINSQKNKVFFRESSAEGEI